MREALPTGPLTPAVFHILMALYGRERHGYDIPKNLAVCINRPLRGSQPPRAATSALFSRVLKSDGRDGTAAIGRVLGARGIRHLY